MNRPLEPPPLRNLFVLRFGSFPVSGFLPDAGKSDSEGSRKYEKAQ